MDNAISRDGWDAIRQIEEFYHLSKILGQSRSSERDASPCLPKRQQVSCRSLIAMVDVLLARNSRVLPDDILSSCLRDHRRWLHEMLPPSRLMTLPYELREQMFAFAITEWDANSDQLAEIVTPPRIVRVLQRRPVRIDRLNKPAPPGRRAASRDQCRRPV